MSIDDLETKINKEYLDELSLIYIKEYGINLLGLDFVYNIENNVYYLIDSNYYPGYKEITLDFNDILTERILNQLTRKHCSNKNINNMDIDI
jgi:hypothetical protein